MLYKSCSTAVAIKAISAKETDLGIQLAKRSYIGQMCATRCVQQLQQQCKHAVGPAKVCEHLLVYKKNPSESTVCFLWRRPMDANLKLAW